MASILDLINNTQQQYQQGRLGALARNYYSGQDQSPQALGNIAQLDPRMAAGLQQDQQARQKELLTQAGQIAGVIASAPDAQTRARLYQSALPKLQPITQELGLPLPPTWDESHLPEVQSIAQQFGGMSQQTLAPRVVGNALVDSTGKVLYKGDPTPPRPQLVQDNQGNYVWVQPPPMPGMDQGGQQDNPVMAQADQMARQLAAQGKTDAEIAPIVNDFIAKNYTPSGGLEMAPQQMGVSQTIPNGIPTGVRGPGKSPSALQERIALAQSMGATPEQIRQMVIGSSADGGSVATLGDLSKTGADYLTTLPKQQADQVRALADGRMQFPSGTALKSPYWQQMLSAVAQYDPSFDAVNYNARANTRKAFTSGKEAQQVNALNTVAEHLGTLSDNIAALNNGHFPLLNSIKNEFNYQMGDPRIARFNTAKKAVADEVAKVWRASGGSEADIQENLKNLNGSQSPEQLNAAVATLTQLIHGKVMALQDQYASGMGTSQNPRPLVSPEAQKAFDKTFRRAGIAVDNAPPATAPNSGQFSGFRVLD